MKSSYFIVALIGILAVFNYSCRRCYTCTSQNYPTLVTDSASGFPMPGTKVHETEICGSGLKSLAVKDAAEEYEDLNSEYDTKCVRQ